MTCPTQPHKRLFNHDPLLSPPPQPLYLVQPSLLLPQSLKPSLKPVVPITTTLFLFPTPAKLKELSVPPVFTYFLLAYCLAPVATTFKKKLAPGFAQHSAFLLPVPVLSLTLPVFPHQTGCSLGADLDPSGDPQHCPAQGPA